MNTILRCLALATAALLSACGGGSLSTDQGQLRLVNATGNLGALDLFADNAAVAVGVPPYSGSGYGNLKQDTYSLDVRQNGNATTLVTTNATVTRKRHQTLVAYNGSGGTMAVTLLDDEEGEPGNNRAKFRVFNTSTADPDKVDVYLVTTACSALDTSAAAPTVTGVSGLQNAYTELASSATAFNLCVTGAGDRADLRLAIPSFMLSNRRIVTVILARGTGGYLLNGIVLDQQGAATQALNASARVRVATSASTAVSVDVNGSTIASGLATANVGPYVLVPAGPVSVKVNGADVTPTGAPSVAPGADLTVLLMGATPTVTLLPDDNTPSSSTARPVKLRLVNGLNGITLPATLTLNNVLVGTGASPGQASAYVQVASSAGLARLEARSGAMQFYFNATATLESGRVYTLFLLGDGSTTSNTGILIPDR